MEFGRGSFCGNGITLLFLFYAPNQHIFVPGNGDSNLRPIS